MRGARRHAQAAEVARHAAWESQELAAGSQAAGARRECPPPLYASAEEFEALVMQAWIAARTQ